MDARMLPSPVPEISEDAGPSEAVSAVNLGMTRLREQAAGNVLSQADVAHQTYRVPIALDSVIETLSGRENAVAEAKGDVACARALRDIHVGIAGRGALLHLADVALSDSGRVSPCGATPETMWASLDEVAPTPLRSIRAGVLTRVMLASGTKPGWTPSTEMGIYEGGHQDETEGDLGS